MQLREVFSNLLKHGRTARIYGPHHPSVERFQEIYLSSALRFLEEHGMIHVELDGVRMSSEGNEILGPDTIGGEMVAGLHAEGVRSLVVRPGVTPTELRTLADLLSRDWDAVSQVEEDLAAAVWRAEMEHVHVDIADRFATESDASGDSLRGDANDRSGRGGGTDRGTGDSVNLREIDALLEELRQDGVRPQDLVRMKQDEAALFNRLRGELTQGRYDSGDRELIPIDPMARKALKIELDALARGEDVPQEWTARIFFEVIRQDETGQGVMELGNYLAAHAIDLLEHSDPDGAAMLVRRTLLLLDVDLFPSFVHREALGHGYASVLLRQDSRRRICDSLERLEQADSARGPLYSLLAPVNIDHIDGLQSLAAELPWMDLRQVAADRWLALQEDEDGALVERLKASSGALLVGPLLALSRLKLPQTIDICLARLSDADPRVREAALRALRAHQSPGVRRAVLEALMDLSPGVRTEALRYLTVYRDPQNLPAIEAQMCAESFANASESEVRAWILAYALVGRVNAISLLRDLALGSRTLPGPPRGIPTLAVLGIARTGAPGSESLLTEIGRREPKLADAVRRARGAGA